MYLERGGCGCFIGDQGDRRGVVVSPFFQYATLGSRMDEASHRHPNGRHIVKQRTCIGVVGLRYDVLPSADETRTAS